LGRIWLAIRSFFAILFTGSLPRETAAALGLAPKTSTPAAPKPAAPARSAEASDGALQMLAILQRDARLVDFLMEDISAYADDQVGAAVRNLHEQCRQALARYVRLVPVIDGVEGTPTTLPESVAADPQAYKLVGNVPAGGKVPGGLLRHKGWRAESVTLPALPAKQNVTIVAPAEIEIE
jgi:hypothetical protein